MSYYENFQIYSQVLTSNKLGQFDGFLELHCLGNIFQCDCTRAVASYGKWGENAPLSFFTMLNKILKMPPPSFSLC